MFLTFYIIKKNNYFFSILALLAITSAFSLFSWSEEQTTKALETQMFYRVNELLTKETNISKLKAELIKIEQELEQDKSLSATDCHLYTIKQLANFEELSGELEDAQAYYYKAAKLATGEEKAALLFEIARLLIEQGYTTEAKENLNYIFKLSTNKELLAMSLNLSALIATSESDIQGAGKTYLSILQNYKGTAGEIKALLGLISLNINNREQATLFLNQLQQLSPDSPEYAIACNLLATPQNTGKMKDTGAIQLKLNPLRFFMSIEDQPQEQRPQPSSLPIAENDTSNTATNLQATSSPSALSEEQSRRVEPEQKVKPELTPIYVQTGSFSDKENADYMIADLKKIGFQATLKTVTINNRIYFKVIIGPFEKIEKASDVLIKLKERGFEGFLLN